jgi:hypothetical protein
MQLEIFKGCVQLGLAGVALYLVLHFGDRFFDYLKEWGKSEGKDPKFDRLCDKIDKLVDSNHDMAVKLGEVVLSGSRDQQDIVSRLDKQTDILLDIQKRVVRVDDRTYKCIGSVKTLKESEVN